MTEAVIERNNKPSDTFDVGDLVEYRADKPDDHYVLLVTDSDLAYSTFSGVVIVPNKTTHTEIGYSSSFVTKGFTKFSGTISLTA